MKKLILLFTAIIMVSPHAYAEREHVAAWQDLLEKQMPAEIGDKALMGNLMRPRLGRSFSRSLSPSTLSRALGGIRLPNPNSRSKTTGAKASDGQRSYATDEQGSRQTSGQDRQSVNLRVDRYEGRVHYSNRDLAMDPEGPDNAMSKDEALARTLKLAAMMRIPKVEYSPDILKGTWKMSAHSQVKGGNTIAKKMEILVTLPRCLQVRGIRDTKCVFVVGSGLRVVWADANDSPIDPPVVWMKASWPDFKMVRARNFYSRKDVARVAAGLLAEQGAPSGVDRLEFGLAYTPSRDVEVQQGLEACSAEMNVAENDQAADKGRLEFLPTMVIYAVATEVDNRHKRLNGNGSSAVSVLNIPLVNTCS